MLNLMVECHNKGQSGNAEIAPSSKKKTRRIPKKLVQVRLEALCQQAVLMVLTVPFMALWPEFPTVVQILYFGVLDL